MIQCYKYNTGYYDTIFSSNPGHMHGLKCKKHLLDLLPTYSGVNILNAKLWFQVGTYATKNETCNMRWLLSSSSSIITLTEALPCITFLNKFSADTEKLDLHVQYSRINMLATLLYFLLTTCSHLLRIHITFLPIFLKVASKVLGERIMVFQDIRRNSAVTQFNLCPVMSRLINSYSALSPLNAFNCYSHRYDVRVVCHRDVTAVVSPSTIPSLQQSLPTASTELLAVSQTNTRHAIVCNQRQHFIISLFDKLHCHVSLQVKQEMIISKVWYSDFDKLEIITMIVNGKWSIEKQSTNAIWDTDRIMKIYMCFRAVHYKSFSSPYELMRNSSWNIWIISTSVI